MKNRTIATIAATVIALGCATSAVAGWRHSPSRTRLHVVIGPQKPATRVVLVKGAKAGAIDFNVSPKTTRIVVDGTYRGTCDEFDGFPQKMYLKPGNHSVRLVAPDGTAITRTVQIVAGYEIELNLGL